MLQLGTSLMLSDKLLKYSLMISSETSALDIFMFWVNRFDKAPWCRLRNEYAQSLPGVLSLNWQTFRPALSDMFLTSSRKLKQINWLPPCWQCFYHRDQLLFFGVRQHCWSSHLFYVFTFQFVVQCSNWYFELLLTTSLRVTSVTRHVVLS